MFTSHAQREHRAQRRREAAIDLDILLAATSPADEQHFSVDPLPPPMWQDAGGDPLRAWAHRRLWEHEEAVAYSRGQMYADQDLASFDDDVLDSAGAYLASDPDHGARLAALVIAGYTGTPLEAVR